MTNKSIIVFLSFALVISLFSTLVISRASKNIRKNNLELKSNLFDCEYINKRNKEKYTQNLFSENRYIDNIPLLDANSDTILIKSIMNNSKLVYRFYEDTCMQCTEDELSIVKQLGDSIGSNNIIIISDYDKLSGLKAIINRKKIKSNFFIYKNKIDLPIAKDDQNIASFFLLHKDLKTQFVFKAGGDQYINDTYYKRIIYFFKNENY